MRQCLDHVVTTQTSFRIDENLTQKNKLFFTYHSREQNFLNAWRLCTARAHHA